MHRKSPSPQSRALRELLGLALIGFVLWLAAIGWLPLTTANAAPEGTQNRRPEQRLMRMQAHLDLKEEQRI